MFFIEIIEEQNSMIRLVGFNLILKHPPEEELLHVQAIAIQTEFIQMRK